MSEKSGIDMIKELLVRLSILEKKIDVMDKNIKIIANSVNLADLITKASGTKLDGFAKAISKNPAAPKEKAQPEKGFKNFKFEAVDASKIKSNKPMSASNRIPPAKKSIMVNGKIKVEKGGKIVPIPDVSVKIYDDKDKLVKTTKTNRAGQWMSLLLPGRYVALFTGSLDGKALSPQNKNFEVPDELPAGKTELEII